MQAVKTPSLDDISYAQRQRLAYIDFCLLFRGWFQRNELVQRFQTGLSAGTRDINLYKELAPNNVDYDNADKRFLQAKKFKPLFRHDPRTTLTKLANDISDGFDAIGDIHFPVNSPAQLNVPNIFVVARLVQAVLNKKAVKIIYTSLSSGSAAREIVPHNIVDNGLRWHVRAFDRKSESFRDFVLTRIANVSLIDGELQEYEEVDSDHNWQRKMVLRIEPHPNNVKHPTAIAMDFGMIDNSLEVEVNAATAGYLLRRWNVDCTEGASLKGAEYQLYLQNRQTIFGAENLSIAPGYKS